MKKTIIIILIILIAGTLWFTLKPSANEGATATEKTPLYWVAPMDPNFRRDGPGKSPMGMDLVPVYADDDETDDKTIVKLPNSVINNLGVRTQTLKRENLSHQIHTVGSVKADENNIESINAYTDGWVRKLYVKETGTHVKKGDALLALYSPELLNAQDEFLLAIKYNNQALISAGRKKLSSLGVSDKQITEIKTTQQANDLITIYSSQDGIVSALNIREGVHIEPHSILMQIENLNKIWVIGDVFIKQANWLEIGQEAIATFDHLPGKKWQGKVDFIYPTLERTTYTLQVRLVFDNADFLLKPNMFADITIFTGEQENVLTIPKEALIRTGSEDRVILSLGDGKFRSQIVEVGTESEDQYVVISGLEEGDDVVISAQFLIDSESSVKASFNRLDAPEEQAEVDHSQMHN